MYAQNDSNQLKAVLIPSTFQCVFNHPDYIVHRPKMNFITKDSKAKVEAKSFAKATFLGSFKNLGFDKGCGLGCFWPKESISTDFKYRKD